MSKQLILLLAVGAAVVMVVQKQAQARQVNNAPALAGGGMTAAQLRASGAMYQPEPRPSVNINGDMWARLLGDGARSLFGATTQDGRPTSGGDAIAAYTNDLIMLQPDTYGPDYLGSISPFDRYLDGGKDLLGW
ncbi:MAG: hypothetical protein ACXW2U_00760 [Telluria sp.]